MIVKLTEKNRLEVLNYLYQESNFNIFPIGDIETFGFDKDFQRVYAELDENGDYLSIFLRYRDNAIYYSHRELFNLDYLDIFKKDPFAFLSGKKEILDLIDPYLSDYEKQKMYFCQAKEIKIPLSKHNYLIKIAKSKEDFKKLYKLLSNIKEFSTFHQSENNFVESKLKSMNMGVTFYIEADSKVISTAATTAETSKSSMVVAVATDQEYRERGLASILMLELMNHYINDKHKDLCLFYDNPKAGNIYQRLGFEFIGLWNMYKLKK